MQELNFPASELLGFALLYLLLTFCPRPVFVLALLSCPYPILSSCPDLSCPVLCPVPSRPVPSRAGPRPFRPCPVLSRPVPSLSCPVLSCPVLSRPVPSRLRPGPVPVTYPILFYRILSRPILSYPILPRPVLAWHLIPSRPVPSAHHLPAANTRPSIPMNPRHRRSVGRGAGWPGESNSQLTWWFGPGRTLCTAGEWCTVVAPIVRLMHVCLGARGRWKWG